MAALRDESEVRSASHVRGVLRAADAREAAREAQLSALVRTHEASEAEQAGLRAATLEHVHGGAASEWEGGLLASLMSAGAISESLGQRAPMSVANPPTATPAMHVPPADAPREKAPPMELAVSANVGTVAAIADEARRAFANRPEAGAAQTAAALATRRVRAARPMAPPPLPPVPKFVD
jgi:hypothetical protein